MTNLAYELAQPGPNGLAPGRKAGFIAPLTLVTIAVIAIALWGAMSVLIGIGKDILNINEEIRLEVASLTMESRLLYFIHTDPVDHLGVRINGRRQTPADIFGLSDSNADTSQTNVRIGLQNTLSSIGDPIPQPLVFDERLYRAEVPAIGEVELSFQDGGGLFNLKLLDRAEIHRLLTAFGVDEELANRLSTSAVDYVDSDDLQEPNGAERDDYRRVKARGPINRAILAPEEIFGALGWSDAFTPARRRLLLRYLTVSSQTNIRNVNTAPAIVLSTWFPINVEQARGFMQERNTERALSAGDVNRLTGALAGPNEFEINGISSLEVRMTIALKGRHNSDLRREVWLVRAANAQDRPFFRRGARFLKGDAEHEKGDGISTQKNAEEFPGIEDAFSR